MISRKLLRHRQKPRRRASRAISVFEKPDAEASTIGVRRRPTFAQAISRWGLSLGLAQRGAGD